MRIRRCAEQQDRSTRPFGLQERLQKRIDIRFIQKLSIALKLVENNEIWRIMKQRRQRQGASETAYKGCRSERLDVAIFISTHRQIKHRAHRLAELHCQ